MLKSVMSGCETLILVYTIYGARFFQQPIINTEKILYKISSCPSK